jgi:hypothetical protein
VLCFENAIKANMSCCNRLLGYGCKKAAKALKRCLPRTGKPPPALREERAQEGAVLLVGILELEDMHQALEALQQLGVQKLSV